jgi:hypothetical protein
MYATDSEQNFVAGCCEYDNGLFDPIKSRKFPLYLGIKGVFKKGPNVCYKDFIAHFTAFKHCPLQSSPLYWRYTVLKFSSIV